MQMIYFEIKGCKEGKNNSITNELWCNLRQEFCKYIGTCPLGYKKGATGRKIEL